MDTLLKQQGKGIIHGPDNTLAMIGEQWKDYWSKRAREGELDAYIKWAACCEATGETSEGLIVINELLKRPLDVEQRSDALLRKAVLQMDTPKAAWATIIKASLGVPDALRGRLHNQRGRILKELRKYDPASMEYTAAVYYWEMHGDPELVGHGHNNFAGLYRVWERYQDAHESVDRAIEAWHSNVYLAQAFDQKALIYIDEGNYTASRRLACEALSRVDDRLGWRAEFLLTLSKCLAGLGEFTQSFQEIDRALEIADYLNDKHLQLKAFIARKNILCALAHTADYETTRLALELSAGNGRQAAHKLGVFHNAVIVSAKKHNLTVNGPTRKSLISHK